jgi:predicted ester cyclase
MNKIETVKVAFTFGDFEQQKKYFSDDFQATDAVGGPPMDLNMWFGMGELMQASMPDAGFTIEDIREEGKDVIVTGHFHGTFENDFDLSAMNMGVIPASGKFITFPSGTSRVSFKGDKISRNHDLDTGPNAGTAGFIAAFSA